ncbi:MULTISPECIES: HPP family protein [Halorussus]|uniref:HPP family protein n=1 Tax=Halorussus TaxID=1070314 RepID=UPI000E217FA1|nr:MULTISPECIES: HPP family protein [Halorussus]NHN60389.1 HPP family protein [Halorussus sp. JP-T4]
MREALRESATAGSLLAVVGALAVATGRPFLFPSLGPSAFLLATRPSAPTSAPRRVAGGHAVGVAAGLVAYHALASGMVLTAPPTRLTAASAALAVSGVASVALTTAGMAAADLRHAPACATTLIVSLGLLSSLADALLVVAAVAVLLATHRALLAADVAPVGPVAERAK